MLLNPKTETFEHLDPKSREIMLKTIEFFENKGLADLKHGYNNNIWYDDFIRFLGENQIFSTLLTPAEQANGDPDKRWDTFRICDMNEILGFYGLSYWYAWQVSILGLGPIWMSGNQEAKQKAARLIDDGAIFAFGLSEKEHGADLYSSEMSLTPQGDGSYIANGSKYYIGNGNKAAMVSTFAKNTETGEYVFFEVDSQHENYECVKNTVPWQGYVAEYALHDYKIDEANILSTGDEAWNSSLNTINVGKFNLGWGAIGICTHAFYEAITHAANRNLYGKYVTDFPHIKQLFVDAYSRLCAMKLFSQRAIDYMRAANPDDRRYLLFNPMVKMKVTTQGEEVINQLWDVIAAKGFEKEPWFEMGSRDIRSLPKLEGTVHVNMALIIKFMKNYFFNPKDYPEIAKQDQPVNDDFLFEQGPTRGLSKIQFHDYNIAYNSVSTPNLEIFKGQIKTLKKLLVAASPTEAQSKDIDFLLILGELFTLVAYGQLIIEKLNMEGGDNELLDQIFDFLVRDFSKFALQMYSKPSSTEDQQALCMAMVKKPEVNNERFMKIWEQRVYALRETYEMNP